MNPKKLFIVAAAAQMLGLPGVDAAVMIDPASVTAGSQFSDAFVPSNLVDGLTVEGFTNLGTAGPPVRPSGHQNNHWLASEGTFTESVIFDLGGDFNLTNLEILNTSNTNWNDSETDTFTIALSTDGGGSYSDPSTPISLQDYTLGFQNVPLSATGVTNVRLNVTNDPAIGSVNGPDVRVGLNEVRIFAIPEPSAILLGAFGIGLIFRRRRRSHNA